MLKKFINNQVKSLGSGISRRLQTIKAVIITIIVGNNGASDAVSF